MKIELDTDVVKRQVEDAMANICHDMTKWIDEQVKLIDASGTMDVPVKRSLLAAKKSLAKAADSLLIVDRLQQHC